MPLTKVSLGESTLPEVARSRHSILTEGAVCCCAVCCARVATPKHKSTRTVARLFMGKPSNDSVIHEYECENLTLVLLCPMMKAGLRDSLQEVRTHPATFFASARNLAHLFLAAFPIFALAAADITRFFTTLSSLLVESPKAFAAARTPVNLCCSLPSCFSSFFSSRLTAERMSMKPPG